VLEPCFDAFVKTAPINGLELVGVPLRQTTPVGSRSSSADWKLDIAELKAAITPGTRLLMLNTPSSPVGKVFDREELEAIASVVREHENLLVVCDEVYEQAVFDGVEHISLASMPGMWERCLSLFSVGKTFCVTGWRLGYIIARPELTHTLQAIHAATNFCAATPLQRAAAHAFNVAEDYDYFNSLRATLQGKRDRLVDTLEDIGLNPVVPQGGYFALADSLSEGSGLDPFQDLPTTPLGERADVQTCKWMTEHVGVTAIPVSPFYTAEHRHLGAALMRFAFCKDDDTLDTAMQRLRAWRASA